MAQPLEKLNLRDLNFCPYELLQLDPFTADPKLIKSAFRKLALIYHPDRNKSPGAREKFEQIKLASEILLSESIKKIYDSYLKAKQEQKERLSKQSADRQKVIEDLLQREKAYKDALSKKMSSTEDEEFMKAETELEKLIREIKNMEKEEAKTEKQKYKNDNITSHFDQSTIKLKLREGDDVILSEGVLRNIFSSFGIIDGVIIDKKKGHKAYVMFRYRDSALKVMSIKHEDENLNQFQMKIVSTSEAQQREAKVKHKNMKNDPIEKLKAKYLLGNHSLLGKNKNRSMTLEELENSLFERIKAWKQAKAGL